MASPGPRLPDQRPAVLLFDWDNTLVDGWIGITAALNAAFDAFEKPRWTVIETKSRVRVALRESFPVMFGDAWERARDIFYDAFRSDHLANVTPMPGAAEALLAGAAWPCGVVSNKAGKYLRAEVVHLGWSAHFGAVVGAGDAAADKPSPEPIFMALKEMGFSPGEDIWYLGDTALDMQAARAAGVTAVLVGDAGHDGGVELASPDLHVHSAHELAAWLKSLA
ncbi:MAG TPA: HAD family hydrolase [Acetobacteraceae bacterium]|jgi:phosphoglycolate phosphatase|nr:HAD family hydrolase [Acetobacteraceae bacterium]